MPLARHARRAARGLTLVEVAITMTVASTLLALGVPSFEQLRERRQIEGAAALFETDVQLTRSEAMLRNRNLRIDFGSGAFGSCYVVHTGSAGDCDCSGEAPVCSNGARALRSARYAAGLPVALQSNAQSMVFDPLDGTVTPTATVRVVARNGEAVHQIVNVVGRVRSCSPTLSGYKPC